MRIYNTSGKDITFTRKSKKETIKKGEYANISLATNEAFNIPGLSSVKPVADEKVTPVKEDKKDTVAKDDKKVTVAKDDKKTADDKKPTDKKPADDKKAADKGDK